MVIRPIDAWLATDHGAKENNPERQFIPYYACKYAKVPGTHRPDERPTENFGNVNFPVTSEPFPANNSAPSAREIKLET